MLRRYHVSPPVEHIVMVTNGTVCAQEWLAYGWQCDHVEEGLPLFWKYFELSIVNGSTVDWQLQGKYFGYLWKIVKCIPHSEKKTSTLKFTTALIQIISTKFLTIFDIYHTQLSIRLTNTPLENQLSREQRCCYNWEFTPLSNANQVKHPNPVRTHLKSSRLDSVCVYECITKVMTMFCVVAHQSKNSITFTPLLQSFFLSLFLHSNLPPPLSSPPHRSWTFTIKTRKHVRG